MKIDKLHNIASVREISKAMIADGPGEITEAEFSEMLMGHAALAKRVGETNAQAFARIFEATENVAIRKAHALTKAYPGTMSLEPTQVGGPQATDVNDAGEAAAQLKNLMEEQRATAPTLTASEAFAKIYSDPSIKTIIERAHAR